MMRWSNDTIGRTASVIGVALAYGVAGCSAGSGDQPAGVAGAPAGVGTGGTTAVTTGGGATTAVTPPTTGTGAVPSGGGGTPVVGGGGTTVIGGGGTTVIGGGGTTTTGVGGTTMTAGGGTTAGGGAPAGGAGGDSNGMGCGQGTFCMPADDLAPPAASDGFQIVSPSTISVAPGAEQFWCYYKSIPGTGEVDVGGFRSWMTVKASHHFITFHTTGGIDGQLVSCPFGSGDWVYATSKSGMEIGMDLPPNVGLPFQAGSSLIMNMHLINTGTDVVNPVVKLNVLYAKNVMQKAGSVFSLASNAQISVPPGGTQTVHGSCSAPAGSNFFLWTTHSHKFTTEDKVDYISGGKTTNIVDTTDWENPGTHVWTSPNFLTTKAGDSFAYSCSYKNTLPIQLTFGETAASNEMCLAIGYYFPAGGASCL